MTGRALDGDSDAPVHPLDRPLNELRDGLLAATQQTEEVTMDAITMDDAIEQWTARHGLTRDQADKLVAWDEEEGLRLRFRPHQWAKVLDRPRRSR